MTTDKTAQVIKGGKKETEAGGKVERVSRPGEFGTFDIDTDCILGPSNESLKTTDQYKHVCGVNGSTLQTAEQNKSAEVRDALIDHLIWRSEQICTRHKAGILGYSTATNLTLSSLTTVLGAAGAIVSGELAKSILSGGAATASGLRSNISDEVFYRYVTPAVLGKISDLRESDYKYIQGRRKVAVSADKTKPGGPTEAEIEYKPRDYSQYSAREAVVDVERYHQKCSFYVGLEALARNLPRYEDTRQGLKTRVEDLKALLTAKETERTAITALPAGRQKESKLTAINRSIDDINRQIETLTLQMIHARSYETTSGSTGNQQ